MQVRIQFAGENLPEITTTLSDHTLKDLERGDKF